MLDWHPVHLRLTTGPAPLSDAFTRTAANLTSGLPHTVELDDRFAIRLVLPSGSARLWRDLDPSAVVSSSDAERRRRAPEADDAPRRAPFRALVLDGGEVRAAFPVVAGAHFTSPPGGRGGAAITWVVTGWRLVAGSVRGAGDLGSFVELAWRRTGSADDTFTPPAVNPYLAARLVPEDRIESLRRRRRGSRRRGGSR